MQTHRFNIRNYFLSSNKKHIMAVSEVIENLLSVTFKNNLRRWKSGNLQKYFPHFPISTVQQIHGNSPSCWLICFTHFHSLTANQ